MLDFKPDFHSCLSPSSRGSLIPFLPFLYWEKNPVGGGEGYGLTKHWPKRRELFKRQHKPLSVKTWGLPKWLSGKEPAHQAGNADSIPWVWKIPWKRKWQTISGFLPPQTEKPGRLQFIELQTVGHNWATEHTCRHINLQAFRQLVSKS